MLHAPRCLFWGQPVFRLNKCSKSFKRYKAHICSQPEPGQILFAERFLDQCISYLSGILAHLNESQFFREVHPFPKNCYGSEQSASAWADANFCSEPAFEQTIPTTPPAQNHHDMVIWPKYEDPQSWSEWWSSNAKCGFVANWSKCKRTNIIESLDIDWPTNINS